MQYYEKTYFAHPNGHKNQKVILALIAANVMLFLIGSFLPEVTSFWLGLNPMLLREKFALWQFVTYMFVHANLLHLAFNMLALFMFGSELLNKWGAKSFLSYYFFSGIGAGLCAFLFTNTITVGASGAIYGLLLAYGVIFPNRLLLVFFVIPMRAKYFVLIFGLIELIASVGSFSTYSGIAHVAHLGGMVFGALYLWLWKEARRRGRKNVPQDFTIIRPREAASVDYILDKVLKYGVESLTSEEKAKLIRAGKFFAKETPVDRTRKNDNS